MCEASRKTRYAQDAQRIIAESVRDVAQQTFFDILLTVVRVEQLTLGAFGDGVEGQISTHQVLFKGDIGRGITGKTVIAATRFTLGTRQRVFVMGFRV